MKNTSTKLATAFIDFVLNASNPHVMSHLYEQLHESHMAYVPHSRSFFPGVIILASYAVGETIMTTKQQKILAENFAV